MPHRFYWKLGRDRKYPALSYLLKHYAGVLKGKVLCDAIEKNLAKSGVRALAITACGSEDALFCPPAVDVYLNEESVQLKTLVRRDARGGRSVFLRRL